MRMQLEPGPDPLTERLLASARADARTAILSLRAALARAGALGVTAHVLDEVDDLFGLLDGVELAESLARLAQHTGDAREHALDARELARAARHEATRRLSAVHRAPTRDHA